MSHYLIFLAVEHYMKGLITLTLQGLVPFTSFIHVVLLQLIHFSAVLLHEYKNLLISIPKSTKDSYQCFAVMSNFSK